MVTAPRTPQTPSPVLGSPIVPFGSTISASPTIVNDEGPAPSVSKASHGIESDKLDAVFNVHDLLVHDAELSREFPFVNIVSVGGQSAGKSTVLSAISGVPLYSATKTATVCPIQVHSRTRAGEPFAGRIELEAVNPVSGHRIRVPFTSVSLRKREVALATRMAQYEARKCGDDLEQMTLYEDLQSMTREQRDKWLAKERNMQSWTANTVILHVSGSTQPNISIIDLPGLMGGENGQLTRALVDEAINVNIQGQNIILVCAAGSGSDLSQDQPAFELARKHDPTGARTICLITKSDLIEDVSSIEDVLLNRSSLWDWQPGLGWWPISPKTAKENDRGDSEILIRAREQSLFRDDEREAGWPKLQQQVGHTFGTTAVKAKLFQVFADTVKNKVLHDLRLSLDTLVGKTDATLRQLPPEEKDPIGSLNKLVSLIAKTLSKRVGKQHKYTKHLHQIQTDLGVRLTATLPIFLPFFETDTDQNETYEPPKIQGWKGENAKTYVYIEEVLELVQTNTSGRSHVFELGDARQLLIKKLAQGWAKVCEEHVEAVWVKIDEAISEVGEEKCGGRDDLKRRIKDLLSERQKTFKADTISFARKICQRELDDPAAIDIADAQVRGDYNVALCHFDGYFSEHYNVDRVHGQGTIRSASATLLGQVAPASSTGTESSSDPGPLTMEERRRSFGLMASVTAWLVRGVLRTSDAVGREAQAQALDFLKEVMPTLQVGLGLQRVIDDVFVRSARLLEPDAQLVEQRQALGKRKREVEEMKNRILSVYDSF